MIQYSFIANMCFKTLLLQPFQKLHGGQTTNFFTIRTRNDFEDPFQEMTNAHKVAITHLEEAVADSEQQLKEEKAKAKLVSQASIAGRFALPSAPTAEEPTSGLLYIHFSEASCWLQCTTSPLQQHAHFKKRARTSFSTVLRLNYLQDRQGQLSAEAPEQVWLLWAVTACWSHHEIWKIVLWFSRAFCS